MINELLRVLFKVIFTVLRWAFNIILLPLKPILLLFPTFDDYLELAIDFFDDYIIKAVSFSREVFLNMTGFPQEMITITVNFSLGIIAVIGTFKVIAFVKNVWRTFKGGGEQ